MRSNHGIFWYSLGLTLLLLLPMVLTVAFFTDQYQKQQLLRQASAADSTLHIEPGAQGVYTLLLVVQQEEPAFVLARADGPQQTVTLCALPGSLRVSAPSGTTTLAECALSAGAGRAAQLLVGTVATGETAAPALHYIAATPATWADCAGRTASARIDTASLLDAAARTRLGYGEDPIAVCTAAQASELIAQLQAALPGAGEGCMARAAVWAAFLRQDPALLAGLPDGQQPQCPAADRPAGRRPERPGRDTGLFKCPHRPDDRLHHRRRGRCPGRRAADGGGDGSRLRPPAVTGNAAMPARGASASAFGARPSKFYKNFCKTA